MTGGHKNEAIRSYVSC